MVENAIKQVKEKVRTLVIATHELYGVVMDSEHVALARGVRFAGDIISRSVKGADGLTAFQRAFQRASHPRAMPAAWREKILHLEAGKKKVQITDKFFDRSSWASRKVLRSSLWEHLLVVWYAELSKTAS